MRPVYDTDAARAADRHAIDTLGVPGIALMETASAGLARAVVARWPDAVVRGVVAVCGPGNNGGDGYGAARWLAGWGVPVAVVSTAPASSGDAAIMREACRRAGVPELDGLTSASPDAIILDALLGTGLMRPVSGPLAQLVQAIAVHPGPVVAVDVPTGLDADTGAVVGGPDGVCVQADLTVTFGGAKPGMYTPSGQVWCGDVVVVDIGVDPSRRTAEIPDLADLAPLWPRRTAADHKHRSGNLLVIAGSTAMAGAAVLCCRGALAAGAGLVTLAVPEGALPRLATLPAEVMLLTTGAGDLYDGAQLPLHTFDAVALGPGLGGGAPLRRQAHAALADVWRNLAAPLVVDADGLAVASGPGAGTRVITPHPGEAARLLGRSTSHVQADRFGAVRALLDHGDVALLKGPHTLVAHRGRPVSINTTGAPTLATAGAGDVLTGVIGALLARGATGWDAGRLGAWVHGRAGELLAARRSQGWTASDVVDAIPEAVELLCTSSHGALP